MNYKKYAKTREFLRKGILFKRICLSCGREFIVIDEEDKFCDMDCEGRQYIKENKISPYCNFMKG
jgi:hypothetical protein